MYNYFRISYSLGVNLFKCSTYSFELRKSMKRYIQIAIEATVLDARQQCPGHMSGSLSKVPTMSPNIDAYWSKIVLGSDEPSIHFEGLLCICIEIISVTADSSIFD